MESKKPNVFGIFREYSRLKHLFETLVCRMCITPYRLWSYAISPVSNPQSTSDNIHYVPIVPRVKCMQTLYLWICAERQRVEHAGFSVVCGVGEAGSRQGSRMCALRLGIYAGVERMSSMAFPAPMRPCVYSSPGSCHLLIPLIITKIIMIIRYRYYFVLLPKRQLCIVDIHSMWGIHRSIIYCVSMHRIGMDRLDRDN
jgi:hypothetical protein